MASAGIFAGLERDRKADVSYSPVGFTARVNAEYWGIGMENTFYAGDPRMRFFRPTVPICTGALSSCGVQRTCKVRGTYAFWTQDVPQCD